MRLIDELRDRAQCGAAILHLYPGIALEKQAIEEGKHPRDFSWTRKRDKRVIYLPAAQGHVPLYQDRLTWWQISEPDLSGTPRAGGFAVAAAQEGAEAGQHPVGRRRYAIMFVVFCKISKGAERRSAGTSGEGRSSPARRCTSRARKPA
jgi:hypothetical protein